MPLCMRRKKQMAIKAPAWVKNGVPTTRGWTDGRTGELLKAMKISQGDIDEFYGKVAITEEPVEIQYSPSPVVDEEEDEVQMEQLNEAPSNDKSIYEMTKLELESLGRQYGVELDRRKNKDDLIEELEEIIELNEQYS